MMTVEGLHAESPRPAETGLCSLWEVSLCFHYASSNSVDATIGSMFYAIGLVDKCRSKSG